MNSRINLLPSKKQAPSTAATRRAGRVRLFAMLLLFGVSAASIVLFLLIALSPLPTLQQQERNAIATLSQYRTDIAKLLLVTDRLRASDKLLAKRKDFASALQAVQSRMPDGVTITEINMTRDTVSVTVTSTSLSLIDTFLNSLVNAQVAKKDFKDVSMSKLMVDEAKDAFTVTVQVVML
jgi:Tfp pilus assembly protein PilN